MSGSRAAASSVSSAQEMENEVEVEEDLDNIINNLIDGNDASEIEPITSSSDSANIEGEFVRGGHNLRQRIANVSENNHSRTPSPSSRSSSVTERNKRRIYKESKSTKSFEEFIRQDDEKQKRRVQNDSGGLVKTMDDYEYKKSKKINSQTGVSKLFDFQNIRAFLPSPAGWGILAGVLGLLCGLLYIIYFRGEKISKSSETSRPPDHILWKQTQNALRRDFLMLNQGFPSQNRETIIHLISAVNSTFSVEVPRQPSAITMLVPPSLISSDFPKCFALKYAAAVNGLFAETWKWDYGKLPEVKVLNSNYFKVNGDNITAIHEDLSLYFSSGGKVLVVQDADKLKKEEHILIFHSFCDNYKAPYKRATFIFIVDVPSSIASKYESKWYNQYGADLSYDVLDLAWNPTISDDHRPAMIARVAATVILLNDGDKC